jgi:membrane protein implicated in regulation of membrane protease activity
MLSPFFQRLPMWALVPILFVFSAALFFGIGFLTGDHESMVAHVVGAVFYAVGFTAIFAIRTGVRRRRAGGAGEPARISRAVRTGTLPDDVDPTRWRAELERQQTLFRRNRWTMPILFVVFAAICVWSSVTEGPAWLAFLVIFAALAVVSLLETRRALRNIPKLLDELGRRPDPRALSSAAPQPTPGAIWPAPDER